jgi:hypothetical protein
VQVLEEIESKSKNVLETARSSFKSLSSASLLSLCTAIHKRLEPDNVLCILNDAVDHGEDDAGSTEELRDRGRQCICTLREHHLKVSAVAQFLRSLYPKKDERAGTAAELRKLYYDVTFAEIQVSSYPLECVLGVMCREFIADSSWQRLRACMERGSSPVSPSLDLSVANGPTAVQDAIQELVLASCVVDLLKKPGLEGNTLAATVINRLFSGDLSWLGAESIRNEITHLRVLIDVITYGEKPDEDSTIADLSALFVPSPESVTAALQFFKTAARTTEITKGWQVYPVLVDVDAAATKFIRDCNLDVGNKQDLDRIAAAGALPGADDFGKNLEHLQKCIQSATKIIKPFLSLLGTVSFRFKAVHSAKVLSIAEPIHDFQIVVQGLCTQHLWDVIMAVAKGVLDPVASVQLNELANRATDHVLISSVLLEPTRDAVLKRFTERRQAWSSIRGVLGSVGKFSAEADISPFRPLIEWLRMVKQAIPAMSAPLAADVAEDSAGSSCGLLVIAPAPWPA